MWGSCCFNTGDIKITLGTGSFLNLNTGPQCHASIYGLYPLVAWKTNGNSSNDKSEVVYCMEGAANDTGSIIQWAINFGMPDINLIKLPCKYNKLYFFKQDYSTIHRNRRQSLIQLMTPKKYTLYLHSVDWV